MLPHVSRLQMKPLVRLTQLQLDLQLWVSEFTTGLAMMVVVVVLMASAAERGPQRGRSATHWQG
ncbi:Hypothetical predicted protein [Xyrichtys novacula]|nr:Hypothetical predicted protein [Xyrichtys novacula]